MSNRHLSRTIAMQTLFEWDFNNRSQKLQEVNERNLRDFAPGLEDFAFVENLVRGVTKNMAAIDENIVKYAPDWPIDKITVIDRNILRLGIYELLFLREVPPKVVINESIEIAKAYGGESSGKFINGVLGAIFRDIETEEDDIITPEKIKNKMNNDQKNNIISI
ncbi:transcription antitermination factor NusB [Candidatus Kuenenbacteria bacterium CG08_land_8_20_14_0_20_37_23]|uniref:Transcription antitermination protein NusB n=2 Tax=Candidatus Kueneniibacteriota TaxID=1752740 RepID=A0A2M6XS96_9BACT|nr:MAG: transcription antitermination factor NusB [Candidatus Kuenenbacteria bacterium CG1_02_38_13]PIU10439.1 MAG: transcription antitermination factor NusB [Candidatus Kuenenbacteria bacterium CG08_land_8_20_14_0_20_37_23]